MCTIRRAKIKKLIKQQRKSKLKIDLLTINLDCLPVIDPNKWIENWRSINANVGLMFINTKPKFKPRQL